METTGPEPRRSSEPQRTCIGCRKRSDRSRLLRVVALGGVDAAGSVPVVPDVAARSPGRGAWVHHDLECFGLAIRRRAFARALRVQGPVTADAVQQLLRQSAPRTSTSGASTTSTASTADRPPAAEAGQHQMGTR